MFVSVCLFLVFSAHLALPHEWSAPPQAAACQVRASAAGRRGGGRERASSKGLDKAAIRNFVLTELARPADRMGPDWLNDDDKAQWSEWLDAEPDNVGSVPAAEMPLPIEMPRKCLPRSASAGQPAMVH